ncbi:MAG: Alkaline phosphatase, partial [Planctomycetaceae bacterium]|nr:Alkaline phosphatase [Planctomycetaceae bacterium]
MFIRPWLEALKSRWVPGNRLNKRRVENPTLLQSCVETLEEKAMLSAVDLITVIPNQGVFLSDNAKITEAPTEMTLRFSPGETITPASIAGAISVVRSGVDGVFSTAGNPSVDDVSVPIGYIGAGDQPYEVIVRFAQALPDDNYEIVIKAGSTLGHLATSSGDLLNGDLVNGAPTGPNKTFHFSLDLGAQVESVVPQPVIRSQVFTVADSTSLKDGDTLTIANGPYTTVLEFNTAAGNVAAGHVFVNRTGGDAAVAAAIASAVNGLGSSASVAMSATATGQVVTIAGTAFEPTVSFGNPVLNVLNASTLTDGDQILLTLGATTVALEFNDTAANPNPKLPNPSDITANSTVTAGFSFINYNSSNATQASVNAAIVAAINSASPSIQASIVGTSIVISGTTGTPQIRLKSAVTGTIEESFTSKALARTVVDVVNNAANLKDADTVTITLGGTTQVYEFNNTSIDNQVVPTHIRIDYQTGANAATIAGKLVAAIAANNPGANPTIRATLIGTSSVALTGINGIPSATWKTAATVIDPTKTVFSQNFGGLTQATDKVVVYFNQDQLAVRQTVVNVANAANLVDGGLLTVTSGATTYTF